MPLPGILTAYLFLVSGNRAWAGSMSLLLMYSVYLNPAHPQRRVLHPDLRPGHVRLRGAPAAYTAAGLLALGPPGSWDIASLDVGDVGDVWLGRGAAAPGGGLFLWMVAVWFLGADDAATCLRDAPPPPPGRRRRVTLSWSCSFPLRAHVRLACTSAPVERHDLLLHPGRDTGLPTMSMAVHNRAKEEEEGIQGV